MSESWEPEDESLREAARRSSAIRKKRIHVGAAVMPDYLNPHYDPYSSILNAGLVHITFYVVSVMSGASSVNDRSKKNKSVTIGQMLAFYVRAFG